MAVYSCITLVDVRRRQTLPFVHEPNSCSAPESYMQRIAPSIEVEATVSALEPAIRLRMAECPKLRCVVLQGRLRELIRRPVTNGETLCCLIDVLHGLTYELFSLACVRLSPLSKQHRVELRIVRAAVVRL